VHRDAKSSETVTGLSVESPCWARNPIRPPIVHKALQLEFFGGIVLEEAEQAAGDAPVGVVHHHRSR